MAGCFPDFRGRATSFDLHNLSPGHKMSLISRLFRSKSDSGLKIGRRSPTESPTGSPRESPRESPRASPGAPPRRRFVRVVRDDHCAGEEFVNPHVIRKYNKGFIEAHYMRKSSSLEDTDRPLPYKVTGHTILKKHQSLDADPACSHKHACFKEEVEVIEYNTKAKCALIMNDACIVHQRLHDETLGVCLNADLENARQDVTPSECSSADSELLVKVVSLDVPLEVIDEHKPLEDTVTLTEPTLVSGAKSETTSSDNSSQEEESSDKLADNEKRPPPERQTSQEDGSSAPKKSKFDGSQTNKSDDVELAAIKIDEVNLTEKSVQPTSPSLEHRGVEVEP